MKAFVMDWTDSKTIPRMDTSKRSRMPENNHKAMRKRDPKYIDVPNICFSHTSKDDSREPKYKKQRLNRGFDNSETWSLDVTFAEFMLPRLERFKEIVVQVNKPDTKPFPMVVK